MFIALNVRSFELEPDQMQINVSNIPANTKSVYIPLKVSSPHLAFKKIEVKDDLFHNFIVKSEKNDKGLVIGISLAGLKNNNLPENVIIQADIVLNKQDVPLVESEDLKTKKITKTFQATIEWDSPWVFTKPSRKLQDSFTGFNSIAFSPSFDQLEVKKANKKHRIEKENENKDFYIKTLGQTIVRETRRGEGKQQYKFQSPTLQKMDFFVKLPSEGKVTKLYVPVFLRDRDATKIEASGLDPTNNVVVRQISNHMLEISTADGVSTLPEGGLVSGSIKLEEATQGASNSLTLGMPLTEPTEVLSGITVSINPSIVGIKDKTIRPLDIFKLN